MVDDRPCTCRLSPKEKENLDELNLSFSEFVHNSFKREMELKKKNTKQETMRANGRNIIFIGLGVYFIFYSFSTTVFLAWIISFLLGVFFLVTGLLDILMEIMKKIKVEKKFGRTKTE